MAAHERGPPLDVALLADDEATTALGTEAAGAARARGEVRETADAVAHALREAAAVASAA